MGQVQALDLPIPVSSHLLLQWMVADHRTHVLLTLTFRPLPDQQIDFRGIFHLARQELKLASASYRNAMSILELSHLQVLS